MLQGMHRATKITLVDAAILTKDADGKLHVTETHEVSGKQGAKRGAIAAGIFGVIFPPSLIASAVVGGAAGAAWGKLRDTGIKSSSIKELGEELEPGKAAVVTLVEQESVPAVELALQGYDGQLVRHAFNASEAAAIHAASTTTTSS